MELLLRLEHLLYNTCSYNCCVIMVPASVLGVNLFRSVRTILSWQQIIIHGHFTGSFSITTRFDLTADNCAACFIKIFIIIEGTVLIEIPIISAFDYHKLFGRAMDIFHSRAIVGH